MNHTCKYCSSQNMTIEKGKPPHLACLVCCDCDRWQKWLSKKAIAEIEQWELENEMISDRAEDKQEILDLYGWR